MHISTARLERTAHIHWLKDEKSSVVSMFRGSLSHFFFGKTLEIVNTSSDLTQIAECKIMPRKVWENWRLSLKFELDDSFGLVRNKLLRKDHKPHILTQYDLCVRNKKVCSLFFFNYKYAQHTDITIISIQEFST